MTKRIQNYLATLLVITLATAIGCSSDPPSSPGPEAGVTSSKDGSELATSAAMGVAASVFEIPIPMPPLRQN